MKSLGINWVDLAVAAILILGLFRGRKHGISEETLPLLRSLLMVGVAGYFYAPVGGFMASSTPFSLLSCHIAAYLGLALAVYLVFHFIKKAVGDKLIGSDLFGKSEYYLGMIAGVIRFASIIVFAFALIHARLYSAEERDTLAKMQQDNFGDISFPTFSSIQHDVFAVSLTGKSLEKYAPLLLIEATPPENKALGGGQPGLRRNGTLNDVLGGNK